MAENVFDFNLKKPITLILPPLKLKSGMFHKDTEWNHGDLISLIFLKQFSKLL